MRMLLSFVLIPAALQFWLMLTASVSAQEKETCAEDLTCADSASRARRTFSVDEAVWEVNEHTETYFPVAGVNLATYGMKAEDKDSMETGDQHPPFELFEEFEISDVKDVKEFDIIPVKDGDEKSGLNWKDYWRWHTTNRDAWKLSFYDDKVAVKRWMQTRQIDIPRPMVLGYASELFPSYEGKGMESVDELAQAILMQLPTETETDFVIKPTHRSRADAIWVISQDPQSGTKRVSGPINQLDGFVDRPDFDFSVVAKDIARELLDARDGVHEHVYPIPKQGVRPGMAVEERFTAYDHDDFPALEFKCIVIWGRLFVGRWRNGGFGWRGLWWPGLVKRDGSMVKGSVVESLPEWMDWSKVVDIAETVGAHKDFFRVDVFVGVPGDSPALHDETATMEEKLAAVRYVVSEISSTSSEPFSDEITTEIMRLWVAGYKIGNYKAIPNSDVPSDFVTRRQVAKEEA